MIAGEDEQHGRSIRSYLDKVPPRYLDVEMENMMATKKAGRIGQRRNKKKITNTHAIPNMIHINSFFPVKLVGHTKKKLFKDSNG